MDEVPIFRDEAGRLLGEVAARFRAPAFVRRARQVQDAFDELVRRCQKQRDEWLDHVRIPWKWLVEIAGNLETLRPLLANAGSFDRVNELAAILASPVQGFDRTSPSSRWLRKGLWELRDSIERFNRRWQKFLEDLNLAEINKRREDYNCYYVLEKECALRSVRLARLGFMPLAPITAEVLFALLPLLPLLNIQ